MSQPLRILMVEDSADDARLIIRELERGGYAVVAQLVDAEWSLRLALAQQSWDAVLCDFTMPQLDGETARLIAQAADADRPFIYVSGTMGEDVAVEAIKSGAHDYVLKDHLARLVPAIVRELRAARVRRERRELEADRERLVVDLCTALRDLKRLGGTLPICANCQRIRNSRNHWQPIEAFIQDHSEARFTHTCCPDCSQRLYLIPPGTGARLNQS